MYAPSKLWESQFQEFQDSHLGIPRQNDIWVLVLWPCINYTIKRKVVASLQSGPWWILWVRVCPWLVRAPKVLKFYTNNVLFGLCRSTWIIDPLIVHPNPISKLQHALLPLKCHELKSAPQFLLLSLFSPLDSQLSPSKSLGVCWDSDDEFFPNLIVQVVQPLWWRNFFKTFHGKGMAKCW